MNEYSGQVSLFLFFFDAFIECVGEEGWFFFYFIFFFLFFFLFLLSWFLSCGLAEMLENDFMKEGGSWRRKGRRRRRPELL